VKRQVAQPGGFGLEDAVNGVKDDD
jgi:hypothetical protein